MSIFVKNMEKKKSEPKEIFVEEQKLESKKEGILFNNEILNPLESIIGNIISNTEPLPNNEEGITQHAVVGSFLGNENNEMVQASSVISSNWAEVALKGSIAVTLVCYGVYFYNHRNHVMEPCCFE